MAKDLNNNLTVSRMKSKKMLLTVSAVSVLICAAIVLTSLIIGGFDSSVMAIPILLLALDAIFLLLVLLSNFRFKYARAIPSWHIVLTTVFTLGTFSIGNGTVFTTAAQTLIIIFHIVASIATVACYKRARMEGVGGNGSRGVAVALLALLIVFGAAYSVTVLTNGWFGQGTGELRTLVYELSDDGESYEVVDVLEGRGDTVVIPESFNGKPVGTVECEALTEENIKTIYIECDGSVELNDADSLYIGGSERTVFVNDFDLVRKKIFDLAVETMNEDYVKLADTMRPSGLEEGECYVTFSYTLDDLVATGAEVLPSWFGSKGEILDKAHLLSAEFAKHEYAQGSSDDKYWAYDNLNKRIYTGVDFDGKLTLDGAVNESVANARVTFAPLYLVRFGEDNDAVYELPKDITHYGSREVVITASEANGYLSSVDSRDGFDLRWNYQLAGQGSIKALDSLESVVADGITLYPVWNMRAPTIISVTTDKDGNAAIYGNDISFLSSATAADAGFKLSYEWCVDDTGEILSSDANWTLENARPSDTNVYWLRVVSSAEEISSLTSVSSAAVSVAVNKRPLDLEWTTPDDPVYSGYGKTVLVTYDPSCVINDDVITIFESGFSVKNVGTYSFEASLTGDCAELYYVTEETKGAEYTVTPAPLSVVWTNDTFVFSGESKAPDATAIGLADDGEIGLSVSGAQINVGSYTASVSTENENYEIVNPEYGFEITPCYVDVVWSNLTLTYNGTEQRPSATAAALVTDLEADILTVNVPESYKNAAEGYSVSAVIDNPNYLPTEQTSTASFNIEKMPISLSWSISSTGNVYNGEKYAPYASAVCAAGDVVLFDYSFTGTSAPNEAPVSVGSYGVVAGLAEGFAVNDNYVISSAESFTFAIDRLPINLSWQDPADLTYDGEEKQIVISSFGVDDGFTDEILGDLSVTEDKATVRGEYTANASLRAGSNFVINTGASHPYEITARQIDLKWSFPDSLVYDGVEKSVTVSSAGLSGALEAEALADVRAYDNTATYYKEGGYMARAELVADSNFIISSGESCDFEIERRPISLSWTSASTLVYNGHVQSVYLSDFGTDERFTQEISEQINVTNNTATYYKEGGYEASAYLDDGSSFVIVSGAAYKFEIEKCPVSISWRSPETLVYDGKEKTFSVSDYGVNTELSMQLSELIVISGNGSVDAGEYTVRAALADGSSFEIVSGAELGYTISPREISLTWCDCSLVYNGYGQSVFVTGITNHIDGGTTDVLSYTGATATDAGVYTAYASAGKNYKIIGGESHTYEISKKTLGTTLRLENERPLVYDGGAWSYIAETNAPQTDAPVFSYLYKKDGVALASAPTDAGSYTVTVTLVDRGEDENYTLAPVTVSFTVTPLEISLSWSFDGDVPVATSDSGAELSYEYYRVTEGARERLDAAPTDDGDYVVVATVSSANYSISEESAEYGFTITSEPIADDELA